MGLARKGTAAYGGTRKVGRPRKVSVPIFKPIHSLIDLEDCDYE